MSVRYSAYQIYVWSSSIIGLPVPHDCEQLLKGPSAHLGFFDMWLELFFTTPPSGGTLF